VKAIGVRADRPRPCLIAGVRWSFSFNHVGMAAEKLRNPRGA
jgi:hypothetical protein